MAEQFTPEDLYYLRMLEETPITAEEEKRVRAQGTKQGPKTISPSGGIFYPDSKGPKKATPKVKIAKKGGYVKSADGCVQRGKTKGRYI